MSSRTRRPRPASIAGFALLVSACSDAGSTGESTGDLDTTAAPASSTSDDTSAVDDSSGDGGTSTTAADDDTGTPGDTGTGDPDLLVGTFQIQVGTSTTSVFGKLFDGESPETLVWEPGTALGDCVLSTPRVPFCAEPCGGSAACIEDDTCQAYPTPQSAGDVTVTGIQIASGEASFVMTPIADNYQPPADAQIVYPGFGAGDPITLSASGDDIGAFELAGNGVAALEVTHGEIMLDAAQDIALAWTAGDATSTVHVKLDISHHGGTKGKIECDTADDGSLDVPAALVAELLDLGVAGFPSIILTRTTTTSVVSSAGRVDLVVSSGIEQFVIIEGLTSCTDDEDCPDEQTCQADLTCQ